MAKCMYCDNMDLSDRNDYGEAFCSVYGKYYDPNGSVCSRYYNPCEESTSYKEWENEKEQEEYDNPSLCYITTIVCEILGKGDNCYELNALRMFRDYYMVKNKECHKLLLEYEFIGPLIAAYIKRDENKERIANYIFNMHIRLIINSLEDAKFDEAIKNYGLLVKTLVEYYGINVPVVDYESLCKELPNELDKYVIRSFVKSKNLRR